MKGNATIYYINELKSDSKTGDKSCSIAESNAVDEINGEPKVK